MELDMTKLHEIQIAGLLLFRPNLHAMEISSALGLALPIIEQYLGVMVAQGCLQTKAIVAPNNVRSDVYRVIHESTDRTHDIAEGLKKSARVTSSLSVGGLQIIAWESGNIVVSADDGVIDLVPEQAKALVAFVSLMGTALV